MKAKTRRSRAQPRGRQRERMRPWLEKQLDSDDCPGLKWRDKEQKVFSISWKHASGRTWSQTDSELFKRYAMHTGKFQEGEEPDPKKWKANFRCALNSLPDVEELKDETHKKGERAVRVYQFKDHCPSASKRKSNTENVSIQKRPRYESSEDSSSQDTDTSEDESPALQSIQGNCVKTEFKEEDGLNRCVEAESNEVIVEDPCTDHDYSQRDTSSSGIPNLPAFSNPDLQSGGSVIIQERKPYTSQVSFDDLKYFITEGSKTADGDLDSNSTGSGENMTDEEVVDMVDSMSRSRAEEGFSESESACNSSPESSPHSHLWNYTFLQMPEAVQVFPENEASVVTQTISESPDWSITALKGTSFYAQTED